jgi:hypothetical protein
VKTDRPHDKCVGRSAGDTHNTAFMDGREVPPRRSSASFTMVMRHSASSAIVLNQLVSSASSSHLHQDVLDAILGRVRRSGHPFI